MKVTPEIIRRILKPIFCEEESVEAAGMRFGLESVASRIAFGLNDLLDRGDQIGYLKAKQAKLDEVHVEATGKIESEMARIQDECPHFSFSERPIHEGGMWSIAVCDICGKILEEEITGNG